MPENISLLTSDGIEIFGDLYEGGPDRFAIFLHMMPSTKEGWNAFATKLATEHGVTGLAIDERGHGASTMSGALDYHAFTDVEQQAKILDAEAAFAYLKSLGAKEENTIVIGGSIGANLAIQFLNRHPQMKRVVALSPGINYRGIRARDEVGKLHQDQKVLVVTSEDDVESNGAVADELTAVNPDAVDTIKLSAAGHAEQMLDRQADLTDRIVDWLKQ